MTLDKIDPRPSDDGVMYSNANTELLCCRANSLKHNSVSGDRLRNAKTTRCSRREQLLVAAHMDTLNIR